MISRTIFSREVATFRSFVVTHAIIILTASLLAIPSWAQVERVEQLSYPPLPEIHIPEPTRVVLDNGLTVLLLEDHELPVVSVSARIRTGSRLEPKEKIGLAGLTGTVMRSGGTTTLAGDKLDDYLEGKAASIETGIGTSAGTASMNSLIEDFEEVFNVFVDVLRNPSFALEKLAIAKNQLMAGIARQNDNPDGIVRREFAKLVYGGHSPYAYQETYATVGSITRNDLMAWHQKYYHPNRMILGLVGDFKTAEALALVKKVFGDWDTRFTKPSPHIVTKGENLSQIAQKYGRTWQSVYHNPQNKMFRSKRTNPSLIYPGDIIFIAKDKDDRRSLKSFEDPVIPYQKETKTGVFYVEKNDMTQAKIIIGHMGLLRKHPDYHPVVITNQILSGSFGARLFSSIRSKKGLAYDVHGGVGFGWDFPATANFSMSTKTETTQAGIDALIEEAHKIMKSEPPTDTEVQNAKASLLNSFVFSVDSPGKVLGKFLTYEYYGYPADWMTRFRNGIDRVTTEEVRRAAQQHIKPDQFVILVVGPRKGTAPALARYDKVHELDISIPDS